MDLTAAPVVVACAAAAAASVVAVPYTWDRWSRRTAPPARSGLVLLATVAVAVAALAFVNSQAGFFPTVSSLLSGRGGSVTVGRDGVVEALPPQPAAPVDLSTAAQRSRAGRGAVVQITLTGARSGLTRSGAVYLPAAYFDPAQQQVRFPVVELLSGSPGNPAQTLHELQLADLLDNLVGARAMAPVVVVVPDTNGSILRDRECVDAVRGVADETYLTSDLQDWLTPRFRVQAPGQGWGLVGMSTGGFCAVNLSLRHPDRYAAAASLSGYYRALTDVTTGNLYGSQARRLANDPSWQVTHRPVPHVALWLSAGTGESGELADLRAFAALVPPQTDLTTLVVPGAGHSFASWRAELPQALAWTSTHLAAATATVATLPGQQLQHQGSGT